MQVHTSTVHQCCNNLSATSDVRVYSDNISSFDAQDCSALLVHVVCRILQDAYLPGAVSEVMQGIGAVHLVCQFAMLVARPAHFLMLPHHHKVSRLHCIAVSKGSRQSSL